MRLIAIALLSVLVLLFSVCAYGDSYNIQLLGSGGLMLNGADYSGDISAGMIGTWTLDVKGGGGTTTAANAAAEDSADDRCRAA